MDFHPLHPQYSTRNKEGGRILSNIKDTDWNLETLLMTIYLGRVKNPIYIQGKKESR